MKLKAFAGLTLTLFLIVALFSVIPVKPTPSPSIKIGILGPINWIQGQGMREGAEIALDEIGGTILGVPVELVHEDELGYIPCHPDNETGRAAALALMAAGCDFVIGGFRTESVLGAREVFMDYKKIYVVCGAATNELVDCAGAYDPDGPLGPIPPGYCGSCVRDNSTRYKYMFRATPTNSTILVRSIATFLQNELLGIGCVAPALGTCLGYPAMYVDRDLSQTVTAGDGRKTPVCRCANGTATYLAPGTVLATDCDVGSACVPPVANVALVPVYGRLTNLYGRTMPGRPYNQTKVAVITEALAWADLIHLYLTFPAIYPALLGPFANVTYQARIIPCTTDFTAEIAAARAAGCHLIIHVISWPAGHAFASQWRDLSGPHGGTEPELRALLVGINVEAQEIPAHWDFTLGKCECETTLAACGQRSPINPRTIAFYDETWRRYGHAPIYTSYGVYDAIITLKATLEAWALAYGYMADDLRVQPRYDQVIDIMNATYNPNGIVGKFQYTGPNGIFHDVYSNQLDERWGTTTAPGYVRAMQAQWQKHPVTGEGRLEVVYPYKDYGARFAKKFSIPSWMYAQWETDIDTNGIVNVVDVSYGQAAWLTVAGDPLWDRRADMDGNYHINVVDIARVAYDIGLPGVSLPLPD